MRKLVVCAALYSVVLASALLAQTGRGVITGHVSDSRAAVIPDVAIVATNTETGARYEAVTNQVGIYSILNLPTGTYAVTMNKAGMRPFERTGINIFVNQTARLDVTMEVGAVTESITVTGDVSPLATETTDVGTGIDNRTILDLPLPINGGRQLESFAYAITPGVEGNAWTSYILGSQNPADAGLYKRAKDRQWTYAGGIGGPVIKNKTFFYGAFERFTRQDYGLGSLSETVPTAAFLNGDFGALLDTSAGALDVDKAGNPIYPGAIFDPGTDNVFPGNIIPQSRLSDVSKRILDIYRS